AASARLDLTGWVTLENMSGAAYGRALLKVVAGGGQRVTQVFTKMAAQRMEMDTAAPSFQEQPFFEYHLYTLDRRTDIGENQTKQIRLLEARGVPVVKKLLLTGD